MERDQQIRRAIARQSDRTAAWRFSEQLGYAWGVTAAWRAAWLITPPYTRERSQFPGAKGEVVQTPSDYLKNGGDCDDDVACLITGLGEGEADFVPKNDPRHVRYSFDGHTIDRVPGAPRWA